MEVVTEMLNRSNREIGRLKQELQTSQEDIIRTKKRMNELQNEKDNEDREYESEIERLRKHINQLEEEYEKLKAKCQMKSEINSLVEEESTNNFLDCIKKKGSKYVREIETKTTSEVEAKLEKINKLTRENLILSEKLGESERIRKKYQERHLNEENTMKELIERNQTLEESISSTKKQLNDAKSLKSYNHKIYEEKIINLNDQIEKLKKENLKLKKMSVISSNTKEDEEDSNNPTLEPVKAKPFLFGPLDTGKY